MESLDERVALLKTIADTTRLRILGLIAERPRTGAELAEELSLSAPTISHHLHRMRDVGIIRAERDGQKRIWSINQQLLDNVHAPTPTTTPVDAEQARTLRIFFDGERLRSIPTKRKARVAVLVELLRRFEAGRDYTEREVGDILGRAHDDVALLRRRARRLPLPRPGSGNLPRQRETPHTRRHRGSGDSRRRGRVVPRTPPQHTARLNPYARHCPRLLVGLLHAWRGPHHWLRAPQGTFFRPHEIAFSPSEVKNPLVGSLTRKYLWVPVFSL